MVMGCENPQNHAQQWILLSVLEGMAQVLDGFDFEQSVSKVEFMLQDIDQALACVFLSSIQYKNFNVFDSLLGQLRVMPGFPEGVYSFWVGMPPETQIAILELCALCPSVDTLAVFRCPNWTLPEHGNVTVTPAIASQNEFAPKYNAIKLIVCLWSLRRCTDSIYSCMWLAVSEHLNNVEGNTGVWRLSERYATIQFGSGQQHQAWIFVRA